MKTIGILLATISLIIAIAACSLGGSEVDVDSTEEVESIGDLEEYPEPDIQEPAVDEYPSPDDQTTQGPGVLYPGFDDGSEVDWYKAIGMVMNGEVVQVVQTHDLKVSLTLRDGRTLVTFEPAIDEIIQLIETCGELCSEIIVATE